MQQETPIRAIRPSSTQGNLEAGFDRAPLSPTSGKSTRTPYSPNKLCLLCKKDLAWFNRKRKCTLCFATVCHECASKKVIKGEIVCRICEENRQLQREFSESPPTSNDPASRQSPRFSPKGIAGNEIVILPPDDPQVAEGRHKLVRRGFYANLNLKIFEARGLIAADFNILGKRTSSDPFCIMTMSVDRTRRATRIVSSTLNPAWNQEFDIPVRTPMQNVEIVVYDHDVTGKDEELGRISIPLDRLPNGKTIAGWMPLIFLQDVDKSGMAVPVPAGQAYMALRIDYKAQSELKAYMRAAVAIPPPVKVTFDINAIYGPSMLLIDLVMWRTLQPVLNVLMYVLWWENFFVSVLAMLVCIPIGLNIAYFPSAFFFFLNFVMVYNYISQTYVTLADPVEAEKSSKKAKLMKLPGGKMMTSVGKGIASITMLDKLKLPTLLGDKKPEVEPAPTTQHEEQSLGGLVSKVTLMSPGWVKEFAASYQPLLRTLADTVSWFYDILHLSDKRSFIYFLVFLKCGLINLVTPFRYVAAATGALIIFSMSPLMGIVYGLLYYLTRSAQWTDPAKFGMTVDFDPDFLSADAVNQLKRKKTLQSKGTTYMLEKVEKQP